MPHYDYTCPHCHTTREESRSVDRRDEGPECCGERMRRAPPSGVPFRLKGKGWYKDGYSG